MVLMDEWLDGAHEDLNAELEYVFSEFGVRSAEEAYHKVKESVDQLCHFPHLGKRFCDRAFIWHDNVRIQKEYWLSCQRHEIKISPH